MRDPPWLALVAFVALASAVVSCGDGVAPQTLVARYDIVGGDGQAGEVGLQLFDALAVRASDSSGRGLRGVSVAFRVAAGGGSVGTASVTTDGAGVARSTWTLGTTVTSVLDSQRVEATVTDPTSGQPVVVATFKATALPGPAARLVKHSWTSDSGAFWVGNSGMQYVRAVDRFGNSVPFVKVAWSASAGGSVSPAESFTTNEWSQGVAGTMWTLGTTPGTYTVTATSAGLAGSPMTLVAFAQPGPVHLMYMVEGDGQVAPVGTAVAIAPAVKLVDRYGNAVLPTTVNFSVIAGGGSVTGANVATGTGGVARVGSWTLGMTAGGNSLLAQWGAGPSLRSVRFDAVGTAPSVDTQPPRTRRELYDLAASFTLVHAGSHADTANASITGELALVDTVSYDDGGLTRTFPMTLVGTFCDDPTHCRATTTWPGNFILGAAGAIDIVLYREGMFTVPALEFHGTLVDRTMTGTATYHYTSYFPDMYSGRFVATKK